MQEYSDKDCIVEGYWQNINYISPYADDLRKQIRLNISYPDKVRKWSSLIHECNSVGVHVRRGDFVKLGWDKGAEYYLNGMQYFVSKYPDIHFFLFSDDPDWCKDYLMIENMCSVVHMNNKDGDLYEFELLKSCKHQIISESTFGWWAAFLNENPEKEIYVPKTVKGDIWLKEWTRGEL